MPTKKSWSKRQVMIELGRLDEASAAFQNVIMILEGRQPPYVKGATKPVEDDAVQPYEINGQINPLWFVEQQDIKVRFGRKWYNWFGTPWPQYEAVMNGIHRMAKEHGIDLASIAPTTLGVTEIEEIDDVLCATDEQLDDLAQRLREVQEVGLELVEPAKKKRWASVLERTIRVRRQCREAVPKKIQQSRDPNLMEVWEYTHAARYMLWTMRSDLFSVTDKPELMKMPPHLVMIFMVIAIARKYRVSHRIDGALIMVPPGHGKTLGIIADRALQLNLRPSVPTAYLHRVKDTAQERYTATRRHFMDDESVGRRRRALFPDVSMTNMRTESRMWLDVKGKQACMYEEGVLNYYGVQTRATGKSVVELSIDDPSDEKEAEQVGTRDETNRAMERTWLNRLRGTRSFFVMVCTAWHKDDFAHRLIANARQGNMNLAYYSQACGGPDDGFTPIWPEMCDSHKLKTMYTKYGHVEYSLIFQNNPDVEESRMISKLHFYDYLMWRDPESRTEEWERFFDAPETEYWISCDPSGAGHRKANRAGAILFAYGLLRLQNETDGSYYDEPRLVMLEKMSIHAAQKKFSDRLIQMKTELEDEPDPHELYRILVESTGGYHATSEHLESRHNLDPGLIIRKPPGLGDKTMKLKKYAAIHLEQGDVLLPGVWGTEDSGDKALELHPEWSDVRDQLIEAGNIKEDDLLDCVRQMCQEVGPRLRSQRDHLARIKGLNPEQRQYHERKVQLFEKVMKKGRKRKNTHLPVNYRLLSRTFR